MMSALTIRIPESLHQNLKALAEREGVSANQFNQWGQTEVTPDSIDYPSAWFLLTQSKNDMFYFRLALQLA